MMGGVSPCPELACAHSLLIIGVLSQRAYILRLSAPTGDAFGTYGCARAEPALRPQSLLTLALLSSRAPLQNQCSIP